MLLTAMTNLNVVCLISGGKDSLFSILHCLENGHEVVALANLHPQHDENQNAVEDLDSYMYQTVGHAIIPLYEKALGLPLYRQEILGSAVNQNKSYDRVGESLHSEEDETEAMLPLLRRVKAYHPEVNAVSTGAILSDYQRTRVESVSIRLGLTPLAYLWQWPALPPHSQTSLLVDMEAVGQDSRIIKVASGGLDDSFLWQNVADPRTVSRLDKAVKRFGSRYDGAVLGEGGEFETLAVAGPAPLWKARIVVNEDERKITAGEAGSASVQVLAAHVDMDASNQRKCPKVRVPPLLESRFQTMLDKLSQERGDGHATKESGNREKPTPRSTPSNEFESSGEARAKATSHHLLSNLTGSGASVADQIQSIMQETTDALRPLGHCLRNVVYTSIILRDMDDFPAINEVYGTYFAHPNPPARVTIACARVLPAGKRMMLSITSVKPSDANAWKGLHVQSRSYWAPANIGPYSQGISIPFKADTQAEDPALVYVAGQIPLSPASMELPSSARAATIDGIHFQTVLSQQHFVRIGNAMQVRRWVCGIAFITAASSQAARTQGKIARQAWDALHQTSGSAESHSKIDDDEADSFDVWDVKHGAARILPHQQYAQRDLLSHEASSPPKTPPLYVVQVDSLPRGASIEWAVYGLTGEGDFSPEIPHLRHLLQTFKHHLV